MKKCLLLAFFSLLNCGFAIAQSTLYATDAVTSITSNAAVSGGQVNIADNWILEVGLCWSTIPTPTTASSKVFMTIPTATAFHGYACHNMAMTGLTCGTTYYVRSYAISQSGTTGYGAQVSFVTLGGASVTTTAASAITTNTASSGGSAIACASLVTQKGVVWSTSINPTTANNLTNNGAGTASYGSSLTGLTPNTRYYVRAYVIDGGITYYGNQITFKTALPAGIVSPYSLTPEWYFGLGGGLTFPSGDYPSSAVSTAVNRPAMSIGNEASTALSYRNKSIAFYSNSLVAFNAASTTSTTFFRDFRTGGDNTCAGSSTAGSVAFPKPNNVDNEFFLILANDLTVGTCQSKGDNRYALSLSAGQVVAPTGPTLILPDANASEALVVGSDGDEGYWVVAHDKSGNQFYKWHHDKAGVITATSQAIGLATSVTGSQETIKFSPCQDKIALSGDSKIQVFNWDRKTGTIGSSIFSASGGSYVGRGGLEFSEDGSQLYFSDLSFSDVYQIDLNTGTLLGGIDHKINSGDPSGVNSWSMQMGPDMNIYTSPQFSGSTFVNRISNNNSYPPTITKVPLVGGASTYQGLINLSWLSPQKTSLTATVTATCNIYDFNFNFKNYFNSNVTVSPLNATLDFGDGTAVVNNPTFPLTHTFPAATGGPYAILYTFYDLYCGQVWTASTTVSVTCSAPVELISFNGVASSSGVDLIWKTALELNNDYFDLQRSADGVYFQSIAHIPGAGTSNRILTYPYKDAEVTSGLVYYKLVQHDYDGTISFSKIIAVSFDKTGSTPVWIAPNPFSSSFTLSKIFAESATISVYDVYGRLLEQKVTNAEATSITLGENLANGSYIVQYLTGSNAYTMHVEKK
jgi:Secretion system C-terminal sorting domain